jgi:hypothetical protein
VSAGLGVMAGIVKGFLLSQGVTVPRRIGDTIASVTGGQRFPG